jgi:hypothetical protein
MQRGIKKKYHHQWIASCGARWVCPTRQRTKLLMVINLDSMERSEIKAEWMAAVSCGSYRWRIDRGYKKKKSGARW